MRIKQLFILLVLLFSVNTMFAQQPLSGCWHPDFIKDWTPEKDPDRKFNRSTVPLQARIPTAETIKTHSQQFPDGQVSACLTMHPMCSQVPAQGANNFIGYNPTYWQYLDLLIWWGGSAGEGIILPPSAPVIDAAHLSGVKVLGQIFYPTTTHSGDPAWTRQMNETTGNGVYPYARKCVEIAEYYGFDGWFLNSETITSTDWTNWVTDYFRYAEERGLVGQEIQLYVMSSSASGAYIEGTAKQKGGSYFVNYGGVSNAISAVTRHVTNGWGDKADAFRSWYGGLEQSGSITGNGSTFYQLFPASGHAGSVDFFNPEEPIWKQVVKDQLGTSDATGSVAYGKMKTVFENESKFWVNSSADVTKQRSGTASMQGLATAIQERSAIQTKPFITTFSAGLGKHRFVNGETKGTQDWYHRGMQTVMPTWRWWQLKGSAATTDITFDHNWDDAYNIGTSINMSGNLTNNTAYTVFLYKTKVAIEQGDKIQFVYKTNKPGSLKIKVATANPLLLVEQTVASSTTNNGWTIDEYDLSHLAGQNLLTIGLGVNAGASGSGFTAQLGQLGVFPANYAPAALQVNNLKVENELGEEIADLRIVWDHPVNIDNLHHYNVYMTRGGVTSLVGQTRNEGFYVPKFQRNGEQETSLDIVVKAVNKNMIESTVNAPALTVSFPDPSPSKVTLTASKTLVSAGEQVTITAQATSFPKSFEWIAPTGGSIVSTDGNKAVMTFNNPGLNSVSIKVTNSITTVEHTEADFINVSSGTLTNVARTSNGGKINSYSSCMTTSNECPQHLIDGTTVPGSVSAKWCAGGEREHWVIFEFNKIYELYQFRIFDCGHKENASDNLTYYRIFTSLTGKDNEWTEVLDMQNVPATAAYNTKENWIKPTLGKYVKFVPYDPDKAITIRIWEFEAYGMAVPMKPVIEDITSSKPLVKTNEEVTFEVTATDNPTSYEWTVTGGEKVSQTDNKAVYKFANEGTFNVMVSVTNAVGTTTSTKENLVQVSNSLVQAIVPLTVKTGFDVDVIAEAKPSADNSSRALDDQGWVFYTSGVQASGALPLDENRMTTSQVGKIPYRFAELDKNNALLMTTNSTGILTFEGSHAASKIYFLATSMNGSSNLTVTINYTDGSKSAGKSFTIQDWCTAAGGTALGSIGRIIREASGTYAKDQVEATKCRIFEFSVDADATKTIESIQFAKTGNYPAIFAVTKDGIISTIELEKPNDIVLKETRSLTVETGLVLNVAKESDFAYTISAVDATIVEIENKDFNEATGKLSFDVKGLKEGKTDITINVVNGTSSKSVSFNAAVEAIITESLGDIEDIWIKANEEKLMQVIYSLGDIEKAANFDISVQLADNTVAEIKDKTIEDDKVLFTVKGIKLGESDITVKLTNGIAVIESEFKVNVAEVIPESLEQPQNVSVRERETLPMVVEYSLGTMPQEDNFGITVVSSDEIKAEIDAVVYQNDQLTFDINGVNMGDATVTITLTNGTVVIPKQFTVTVTRGVGLEENGVAINNIYPNPVASNDVLNIETENVKVIRLVSLQGVILTEQMVNSTLTQLSLDNIPMGTYFVQVIGETTKMAKIIVK